MLQYNIHGIYPDGCYFYCRVEVSDLRDAIAIAQGLRKVTTIREVAVLSCVDARCVFHDRLQPQM